MNVRNILVPLDGSPVSEQAIPHAEELARAFGARLTLLRVGKALAPEALGLPELSMAFANELQHHQLKVEEKLLDYLEGLARPLRERGIEVASDIELGDAASVICRTADSEHVDLVVMTSHGRTGLARFLYGSVAERVLHNVHCSLLVVRVDKKSLREE